MSSETINESRMVPRFSNLRDLNVTYEGHSEDIATRPPDISPRGMFINTVRNFPVGAVLQIRFKLRIPESRSTRARKCATASPAWEWAWSFSRSARKP